MSLSKYKNDAKRPKMQTITNFFTLTTTKLKEPVPDDNEITFRSAPSPGIPSMNVDTESETRSPSKSDEPVAVVSQVPEPVSSSSNINDSELLVGKQRQVRASVSDETFKGWCRDFPWLSKEIVDDQPVMICKICKEFGEKIMNVKVTSRSGMSTAFITGYSVWKRENVKRHDTSTIHKNSQKASEASTKPREAPLWPRQ